MRPIFTIGYEVEQGFLSSKTCDAIVSEASKLDAESLDCPVDVLASEVRIWRAEQCLSSVNELLSDEFLRPYEELFGQKFSFCIYNEVSPGLLGSGGGWHRDTRFKDQYKILIYLTDCKTRAEGCFKYIPVKPFFLTGATPLHRKSRKASFQNINRQTARALVNSTIFKNYCFSGFNIG